MGGVGRGVCYLTLVLDDRWLPGGSRMGWEAAVFSTGFGWDKSLGATATGHFSKKRFVRAGMQLSW